MMMRALAQGISCAYCSLRLLRSVFHASATYVQKNLLLALYQRKGDFRRYLLQNIALGVGFAVQRNAIQWSTKNLALVWQRKLTKILHERLLYSDELLLC